MAPLIGLGKKKEKLEGHLPLMDLVIFTVVANVSIISLNTSLMVNSVAFYQIAKLGIIPFTASVEATFFGKEFSGPMKLAIGVTLVGVGLVTVAEFNVSSTLFAPQLHEMNWGRRRSRQLLRARKKRSAVLKERKCAPAALDLRNLTGHLRDAPRDSTLYRVSLGR